MAAISTNQAVRSAVPGRKNAVPKKSSPAVDYTQILLPALILTAICATATLLLALTNLMTTARIADNAARKAAESRMTVLEAYEYVKLDEPGNVYEARNANG